MYSIIVICRLPNIWLLWNSIILRLRQGNGEWGWGRRMEVHSRPRKVFRRTAVMDLSLSMGPWKNKISFAAWPAVNCCVSR